MLIYFFVIFSLYYLFIGLMIYGWRRNKAQKNHDITNFHPFISIIIAVRNEEKNISRLLECISRQSIAKDQFELIIVDDHSDDNTRKIIEKSMDSASFNCSLINSDWQENQDFSPKKYALTKGVQASKGEILVMTDGDCWFGKNWLKSMVSPFYHENIMLVSGPVVLKGGKGIFSKIQTFEFSSLSGSGAAMIELNYPLMCNGANLAIRKSAFLNVKGYADNAEETSGDDVFLMQKIHKANKNAIKFMKSSAAIVNTPPQPTISSLINQRRRWASKWDKYLLIFSWALPVFLFIHYISLLAVIILLIYDFTIYWKISAFLLIKFILDYLFLKKVMNFYKLQVDNWIFLVSELLYPFYALFLGIAVHFGDYTWKGRSHNI